MPITAEAVRSWAQELPGRGEAMSFQDRLEVWKQVRAIHRELGRAEVLLFLFAAAVPSDPGGRRASVTGRSLTALASVISSKSLKRAAAGRLERLHRDYPGGWPDYLAAWRARSTAAAADDEAIDSPTELG